MKENEKTRGELAGEYFLSGYNCSQSVVKAFADLIPVDAETLLKMSSSFGGGMGRLREVCGTVSGSFLILGALYGYDGPETGEKKAVHYARIQEFARAYEEKQGSIVCRELLGLKEKRQAPTPEARTAEYYKKRPCKELAVFAADLLEAYIREHPYER